MKPSFLDTNTATIGGFWIGLISLLVGIFSTAIAIYTIRSDQPNLIYIALSGWAACIIITVSMAILGMKVVKYAGDLDDRLLDAIEELASVKKDNQKLLEIDAYIVSKAVKQSRARAQAPAASPPQDLPPTNDGQPQN